MQQIILRCGPYESPGGAQNQMMESTVDLLLEVRHIEFLELQYT